jgi:hypothetical protein
VEIRPELLDVRLKKGPIKVLWQDESHEARRANRQVCISRKVEVQEQGKRVQTDKYKPNRHFLKWNAEILERVRGHEHSQNGLLEEAEDDPLDTGQCIRSE